jgi:hypothetical protein
MFITIQYPLFDYRYIKDIPNRDERPNWPEPDKDDYVRYVGEIFDRNKPYLGPWDDEKKYCNAYSVINLCGMGEEHYYKMLFSSQSKSRILFRRFQTDGKCMAKFELGFNDNFEQVHRASQPADAKATAAAIYGQVQRYLLCPVKIKTGIRLSPFMPLADAGSRLKTACYWATQKGKKTFADKDTRQEVDCCETVLLLHLDASKVDISAMQMEKVDIPGLFNHEIQLYHQFIPYRLGNKNYNLKTWIICTNGAPDANPVLSSGFGSYNETIRYLRINLLRIHTEIILQRKLIGVLTTTNDAYKIRDTPTRDRLYNYLHKLWLNLAEIKRNKQPQDKLVEIAFNINETYYRTEGIDEQIGLLKHYEEWLKTLNPNPKNELVKKAVQKTSGELKKKKARSAKKKTVFISYNHADEDTAALLKKKLLKKKIEVILDSDTMIGGTLIDDFITQSIKTSHATISIVSTNSLSSGWVGIETVNTLSFKRFFPEKKFIPCYIDTEFFDNKKFTDETRKKLKKRISDLKKRILQRDGSSEDLDTEKNRLDDLYSNLPKIMAHLKINLCIDIRPGKLEENFPEVLKALQG